MGKFLHTLGARAFDMKWWGVGAWVLVLALLGGLMALNMQPMSSSLSIPGTQAQDTLERFNELFPEAGAQSGRIVIQAPEGETISQYEQQIVDLSEKVASVESVGTVVDPFTNPMAISDDGTIAYISVQVSADASGLPGSSQEAIEDAVEGARVNGLAVEMGGALVNRAPDEILGVGEIAGVAIALVVLMITLGSLVAAGLPIVTAIVTVGASMAGLFALSPFIDINSTTPALAVMLGLAVGIDYSLFIVNRYRTFVAEGYPLREAAGRAIATAGNAVLFAAATVVIALSALAVIAIPFITTMGLAAAATVALAAIVALTLVPAVLGIIGMRVFGRKERQKIIAETKDGKIHEHRVSHGSVWYRLGSALLRFRWPVLLVALAIIAVMALPVGSLRMGLPTDETAAEGSSARSAYELMNEGFGPGSNGPLLMVVENVPPVTDEDYTALQQRMIETAGIDPEQTAQLPAEQQAAMQAQLQAQVEQYITLVPLGTIADRVAEVEGVESATPALVTDDGTKGVIQITPTTGPSDAKTAELVANLRDESTRDDIAAGSSVTYGITGTTAIEIDINSKLASALPVYLVVVVGLSLVLLLIAFRSILIPLKATLGFLLSVVAMFGALVAVFQWGWFGIAEAPGPIVSFIPIIGIGILFGLAMDYEFFLVSGMQESYHHKKDARAAIVRGFAMGSRVVVAAALIMIAVFAGFVTNHDATIQALGFALAVGILVDAFLVRLIIVPIVMSFLGKSAWWLPKWLDRVLPRISIEGETKK